MLKKIPKILSPDLLKVLMEMGHGDEIVIADGNFPAASNAQRLIQLAGHGVPEVLEGILQLFPLDTYVDKPVTLMGIVPGDDTKPAIWNKYKKILNESGEQFNSFNIIERFEFYERARKAYAIIATSESALYANIILQKGVIKNLE